MLHRFDLDRCVINSILHWSTLISIEYNLHHDLHSWTHIVYIFSRYSNDSYICRNIKSFNNFIIIIIFTISNDFWHYTLLILLMCFHWIVWSHDYVQFNTWNQHVSFRSRRRRVSRLVNKVMISCHQTSWFSFLSFRFSIFIDLRHRRYSSLWFIVKYEKYQNFVIIWARKSSL